MSTENIVIGVLSYNTEKYIKEVLNDLIELNYPIVVIDDASSDNSLELIKEFKDNNKNVDLKILNNKSNKGAGYSCREILKYSFNSGFKFMVKVDGDGQFDKEDIGKIISKLESGKFDFIKSNRFWDGGITGNIPKIRYFGNLLATQFLHFAIGTNKLFDPLNGLFSVNTNIYEDLNNKKYPKRYGYPFFITAQAVLNNYISLQINNKIKYSDQESNIKPYKLFLNLIRQTIYFNRKKYKLKKNNYKLHKSLFYEINFRVFLILEFLIILRFVLGYFTTIPVFQTNIAGWGILIVIFGAITVLIYSYAFNVENNYRKNLITLDE